ncbi:KTSC domain-containing protein [Sphingopyxis bauzanensis]|uniref:KTSC domain-containing protein n=1 Tax=Sphingopyxis bauzanensis TaxID=651663 RepID=A0A246JVA3_9SPHN|nr:KTSC domain-containing protein [Sphingopyxis bauzanensis]OWQ96997.1 KTSC domain-containing protein [Sphingopyxis bauzanensis]GGJ42011.1 hypothetical protein GCM10011393_10230 [Sphingopyxis bauzanensis]
MRVHRFPASSTIEELCYDPGNQTLCIAFRETGRYVYDAVPEPVVEAFCRAPSAGGFFNAQIRDRYRFRRDPARKYFGPSR